MLRVKPMLHHCYRSLAPMFGLVLTLGLALFLDLTSSTPARAAEPFLEFLHGLESRGYGEAALDYLAIISERKDLPEDVRGLLDLEKANALRTAASETQNADLANVRTIEAKAVLDKFLKEHADSPQAAAAFVSFGDLASTRATELLRAAQNQRGKEAEPKYLEAREAFVEARPRYAKAVELYTAQVDKLKAAAADATDKPKKRIKAAAVDPLQQVEDLWYESRFKLAVLDYDIGRTYTDLKDKKRKEVFDAAAKGFDDIYQPNRTTRVGIYAHMWEGRVREEQGDLLTANDIYEEVLANAPAPGGGAKADDPFAALFAEVEMYRLGVMLKQEKIDDAMEEAEEWLKEYSRQKRSAGYQGIASQLARLIIAKGDKATAAEKAKMLKEARGLLVEAVKVPGPHNFTSRVALLQLDRAMGGGELKAVADAQAFGADLESKKEWQQAVETYDKGLELAKTSKDPKDAARLPDIHFRRAYCLFMLEKTQESVDAAEALARERATIKGDKTAPLAASLAVGGAMKLYGASRGSPNEAPALDHLQKICAFAIETWPETAEADDARIALGDIETTKGNMDKAITAYENVNSASDRYAVAMFKGGRLHFFLFMTDKKLPPEKQTKAGDRELAIKDLTQSLVAETKALTNKDTLTPSMIETKLLLAEIFLEGNEAPKSVEQLNPVFDDLKANKPKALDASNLRICLAAVRSYLAVKDMAKAEEVAMLLLQVGDDSPQINNVLVDFLRNVKLVRDEASAATIKDPADAKAKETLAAYELLLGKLLKDMSERKELSLAALVFIGNGCFDLKMNVEAGKIYQFILDKAEKDPSWVGGNAGALIAVRSKLIGLLRADAKYEQALSECDKLIATHPNALDVLMEKGRILQDWSKKDPTKFGSAIAWWNELRLKLQRVRSKKKPTELYEVIYNCADCLMMESAELVKAGNSAKAGDEAKQASQLLKSTLTLAPRLSGAEMVARYQVLMEQANKAAGIVPTTEPGAVGAPGGNAAVTN